MLIKAQMDIAFHALNSTVPTTVLKLAALRLTINTLRPMLDKIKAKVRNRSNAALVYSTHIVVLNDSLSLEDALHCFTYLLAQQQQMLKQVLQQHYLTIQQHKYRHQKKPCNLIAPCSPSCFSDFSWHPIVWFP